MRRIVHTQQNTPPYDAHCHLEAAQLCQGTAVVNGTSPEDWPAILELTVTETDIIPAIGLHPWKVADAPADWQDRFIEALDAGARAVGEVGLDRHFAKDSFEAQCEAFTWQLRQAAERDLPLSIHCLKATDPLLHLLRDNRCPARGFHLHAYSGSAEELAPFLELGAYVSFHDAQLQAPARKAPQALREIPLNRLLIETDAPDTVPEASNRAEYLQAGYQTVARIRGITTSSLLKQIAENFKAYFLDD